jgi:hypothetical protein
VVAERHQSIRQQRATLELQTLVVAVVAVGITQ